MDTLLNEEREFLEKKNPSAFHIQAEHAKYLKILIKQFK